MPFLEKEQLFWDAVDKGKVTAVGTLLREDQTLVHSRAPEGETPLFWAVHKGKCAVAKLLLDAGADINARGGEDGQTPFACAIRDFDAWHPNEVEMVELLLQYHPDLSIADKYGGTPVDRAAIQPELAALLQKHGMGLGSDSAPHLIAALEQKGLKHVQQQLEADPTLLRSPRIADVLDFAMMCFGNRSAPFVKFLLDQGVDANATSRGTPLLQLAVHYNCAQGVRLLLEHGADVARLERGGREVLIHAIRYRLDKQIVSDLIRFGARKDLTVELYLAGAKKVAAEIRRNPNLVRELEDPIEFMNHAIRSRELVEVLLNLGVDPNAHGPTKPAPLRLAVRQLSLPVVTLLLEHGADPNPKDVEADDRPVLVAPIEHSKAPLLKKIVDYLLAHGAKGYTDAGAHEKYMSILNRLARRAKKK